MKIAFDLPPGRAHWLATAAMILDCVTSVDVHLISMRETEWARFPSLHADSHCSSRLTGSFPHFLAAFSLYLCALSRTVCKSERYMTSLYLPTVFTL